MQLIKQRPFKWGLFLILFFSAMIVALNYSPTADADTEESVPTSLAGWTQPFRLSNTSSNGAFISVLQANSAGDLIVAYNHRAQTSPVIDLPYYRRLPANSTEWSDPASIHTSSTSTAQVSVRFDSNDVAHALWRTNTQLFYSREDQWASNTSLAIETASSLRDPVLGVDDNGVLHAIWIQNSPEELFHSISTNNGGTWSSGTAVTDTGQRSSVPSVTVDSNGDVHVVWEERIFDATVEGFFRYETRYKKGDFNGSSVTWDASPTILATKNDNDPSLNFLEAKQPAIIAHGTDLHVTFAKRVSDDEQYAFYMKYTTANGWNDPVDTTPDPPSSRVYMNTSVPFILFTTPAICDDTVYVYYHGALTTNGKEQILGSNGSNGNWVTERDVVTNGTSRTIRPSMVCIGSSIHVVYENVVDPNNNHQIYYARKADGVYLPLVFRN